MRYRLWLLPILCWLLAAATTLHAQQTIAAGLSLDRNTISVGDQVVATVIVAHPPRYQMQPPSIPWKDVELLQTNPPQNTAAGSQLQVTFTAWEPGHYELTALELSLMTETGEVLTAVTPPITFTVQSVLIPDDLSLRDIQPQAVPAAVHPWGWLGWLLAMAIGGTIWVTRRPVVPQLTHKKSNSSRQALAALAALADSAADGELATAVTHILRTWLIQRYALPASNHTTQELPALLINCGFTSAESIPFHTLLRRLDKLRFSLHPNPAYPADLLAAAQNIITAAPPPRDSIEEMQI